MSKSDHQSNLFHIPEDFLRFHCIFVDLFLTVVYASLDHLIMKHSYHHFSIDWNNKLFMEWCYRIVAISFMLFPIVWIFTTINTKWSCYSNYLFLLVNIVTILRISIIFIQKYPTWESLREIPYEIVLWILATSLMNTKFVIVTLFTTITIFYAFYMNIE